MLFKTVFTKLNTSSLFLQWKSRTSPLSGKKNLRYFDDVKIMGGGKE